MEVNSYERIDLSGNVTGDLPSGELSEGEWKVMIYTLKPDHSSGRNHVDYRNPDDVNRFIELTYLHKTQGGRDIYCFANSSDTPVNTPVKIRGNMKLETWDPQTGEIKRCNTSTLTQNGTDITRFQLTLDPVKS
jgi:hypothetical protein